MFFYIEQTASFDGLWSFDNLPLNFCALSNTDCECFHFDKQIFLCRHSNATKPMQGAETMWSKCAALKYFLSAKQ